MKNIKESLKYLYDSENSDFSTVVQYKEDTIVAYDEINTSITIYKNKSVLTFYYHDNTFEFIKR